MIIFYLTKMKINLTKNQILVDKYIYIFIIFKSNMAVD